MRSKIVYGLLALLLLAACSSASGAAPEVNSKDDVRFMVVALPVRPPAKRMCESRAS